MSSDDSDIERIKEFASRHGHRVVYGLFALLIAAGGGYFYWRYQARQVAYAAGLYNEMLGATMQHRYGLATVAGTKLEKHYASTPYAGLGALLLARVANDQNKVPEAMAALRFAAHHGRPHVVQTVARLRLAALLVAAGHPRQAYHWTRIGRQPGFQGQVLALRGQILAAEHHLHQAAQAYTRAIALTSKKSPMRQLLELERAQLAVAS
ncbi:MAG: tetratricopeptide repeat protein [Gammaproteobacteria bacterium]|nr:tetratricopeptide repeat protein [Gammaproteobacteria bacterium]